MYEWTLIYGAGDKRAGRVSGEDSKGVLLRYLHRAALSAVQPSVWPRFLLFRIGTLFVLD